MEAFQVQCYSGFVRCWVALTELACRGAQDISAAAANMQLIGTGVQQTSHMHSLVGSSPYCAKSGCGGVYSKCGYIVAAHYAFWRM